MSLKIRIFVICSICTNYTSGFSIQQRNRRSLVHYAQNSENGHKLGRGMNAKDNNVEEELVELIKKPTNYEQIVQHEKANKKIITDFVEVTQVQPQGRGATSDPTLKWNYKMTIIIEPGFTDEGREAILSAIYTLSQAMKCFEFYVVKKGGKVSRRKDHLVLRRDGKGCYSMLGRQQGQQVTVMGEGCNLYGTTMHEIMHVLGFFHEHVRPDRDDYVEVNWNELKTPVKTFQYEIRRDQLMFTSKYDFDSLMHYPLNHALIARRGKIPAGVQPGQRDHLSETDIKRLQGLYPCSNAPSYKKK